MHDLIRMSRSWLGACISARLSMVGVALGACLGVALAASAPVYAAGTDRLNAFMSGTQSGRAEFTQRISNRDGKIVQESRGLLEFLRPGRFRWVYQKPYEQIIVGDGQRVWLHDPDLNQVTVRKLNAALGSTPAALLAGNNDALKAFDLKDDGERDGIAWVLATPRAKDGSFEVVRLGFSGDLLAVMELTDTFGQRTVLRFSGFTRNPKLDAGLFRFTPPAGADVVGDK